MKKKAITIFAEVKKLIQPLQSVIIEHQTIWDNITLVFTLDSLYDDFKMTTAFLLYSGNKNLKKIQQIITFTKIANIIRQAIG